MIGDAEMGGGQAVMPATCPRSSVDQQCFLGKALARFVQFAQHQPEQRRLQRSSAAHATFDVPPSYNISDDMQHRRATLIQLATMQHTTRNGGCNGAAQRSADWASEGRAGGASASAGHAWIGSIISIIREHYRYPQQRSQSVTGNRAGQPAARLGLLSVTPLGNVRRHLEDGSRSIRSANREFACAHRTEIQRTQMRPSLVRMKSGRAASRCASA